MPLPRKVREQAEAADAAVAELNRLETPTQPLVDPTTGAPLVQGQPPVVDTPPVKPTEDWENKYRSLQGKYDSEVPLMRSQLQNYERMNAQLSGQLANLSDQVRLMQERPAPVATPVVQDVTDTDVSQFGPELIDLIRRVSGSQIASQIANVRSDVDSAIAPVRGTVQAVASDQRVLRRQSYDDGLTASVPDWREINRRQDWLTWLGQFDPMLGTTRQAAVSAAYDAYDVPRTVAFLKQYLAEQAPGTQIDPQEELRRQASPRSTPGNVANPPATTPASKRVWTQNEIAEAYTRQIQGRSRLAPDAWAELEAEITQAVAEGRVR